MKLRRSNYFSINISIILLNIIILPLYAKEISGVNNVMVLSNDLSDLGEHKLKLLLFSIVNTCYSPLVELCLCLYITYMSNFMNYPV